MPLPSSALNIRCLRSLSFNSAENHLLGEGVSAMRERPSFKSATGFGGLGKYFFAQIWMADFRARFGISVEWKWNFRVSKAWTQTRSKVWPEGTIVLSNCLVLHGFLLRVLHSKQTSEWK